MVPGGDAVDLGRRELLEQRQVGEKGRGLDLRRRHAERQLAFVAAASVAQRAGAPSARRARRGGARRRSSCAATRDGR